METQTFHLSTIPQKAKAMLWEFGVTRVYDVMTFLDCHGRMEERGIKGFSVYKKNLTITLKFSKIEVKDGNYLVIDSLGVLSSRTRAELIENYKIENEVN